MILNDYLNNKRILFFSNQTFNLEKEIISKLQSYGARVDYYDERPKNNNFTKGVIRLKRELYHRKINTYYTNTLQEIKNNSYDFIFVNRGEVITEKFLIEFKKQQPKCKSIFYTWDSFKNCPHGLNIIKYFDRRFTFDHEDAIKYGLEFRPLFFLDVFRNSKTAVKKHKFDLLFLGTAHSDRYILTNKIIDWCHLHNLKTFSFFWMQGRLVFLFKTLFDKSFKKIAYKKLSFKSLTSKEIIDLYASTKVVLDINHPEQKGLTMRTFETIGSQKKMITTNKEVEKYVFYNPNNIKIIDRNNIQMDLDFFMSNYEALDDEVYEQCSIEGWLSYLFLDKEFFKWTT
jgi:hypothetical protein